MRNWAEPWGKNFPVPQLNQLLLSTNALIETSFYSKEMLNKALFMLMPPILFSRDFRH